MSLSSIPRWFLVPIILVGSLSLLTAPVQAKSYEFCELARLLHNKHGIAKTDLPNWLCLVKWGSFFDTGRIHTNTQDGSTGYGLFQINDRFWCDPDNGRPSSNNCQVKCFKLLRENQDDAIKCAKKIYNVHGFNTWTSWQNHCRGKKLPDAYSCF